MIDVNGPINAKHCSLKAGEGPFKDRIFWIDIWFKLVTWVDVFFVW